jgi:hypothetical protein
MKITLLFIKYTKNLARYSAEFFCSKYKGEALRNSELVMEFDIHTSGVVKSCRWALTFWRIDLPPSSELKNCVKRSHVCGYATTQLKR